MIPGVRLAELREDAVAYDDGRNEVCYGYVRRLHEIVESLASKGIRAGDHVAWCPGNDVDSFLTFWALQVLGAVACPISGRFPGEKRQQVTEQLDAHWLPSVLAAKESICTRAAGSESSSRDNTSRASKLIDFHTPPATIVLSSGSTGSPKAIVHSLAAHIASAVGAAKNMPLDVGDRWLWSLPLYHVSGLSIVVRCAVAGATVVGMRSEAKLDAELLRSRRISHLSVVNTQLRRLLEDDRFPGPDLKRVLVGGSSVQASLIREARSRGVQVHTTYGLTEMASQVTTSSTTTAEAGSTSGHVITSGRVLDRRELKICTLGGENTGEATDVNWNALAGDRVGEILVRGETLCLGYYRDGTIESVVDEDGWFHTGDRGKLTESGELVVEGRIDNMFISGGENIYPEAIERAMIQLLGVEQVVVVAKPDVEFGQRPVAFVAGTLPPTWKSELKATLRSFEIPTQILPWPDDAQLAIKPDRKRMQQLVPGKGQ